MGAVGVNESSRQGSPLGRESVNSPKNADKKFEAGIEKVKDDDYFKRSTTEIKEKGINDISKPPSSIKVRDNTSLQEDSKEKRQEENSTGNTDGGI